MVIKELYLKDFANNIFSDGNRFFGSSGSIVHDNAAGGNGDGGLPKQADF